MTTTSPAAIRQRNYRERQKRPLRKVAKIEYAFLPTVEALTRRGLISGRQLWRLDEIETALSLVVQEWVAEALRR